MEDGPEIRGKSLYTSPRFRIKEAVMIDRHPPLKRKLADITPGWHFIRVCIIICSAVTDKTTGE